MTQWLQDWFNQASVQAGDPTRRAIADVHKFCGDQGQELKAEAVKAGWHVVATSTHYVRNIPPVDHPNASNLTGRSHRT